MLPAPRRGLTGSKTKYTFEIDNNERVVGRIGDARKVGIHFGDHDKGEGGVRTLLATGIVLSLGILSADILGDAHAGQYKTLDTTGLAVNAEIQSLSSPFNSGSRMEPDVFEWMADKAGSRSYRCAIRNNNTGRILDVVMYSPVGVTTSCAAVAGGECETAAVVPEPGQKTLCVVGARNQTVRSRTNYTFAVKRAS